MAKLQSRDPDRVGLPATTPNKSTAAVSYVVCTTLSVAKIQYATSLLHTEEADTMLAGVRIRPLKTLRVESAAVRSFIDWFKDDEISLEANWACSRGFADVDRV
jgi:hypothetical protein